MSGCEEGHMHFRDVAEQAGGAFVALVGIIMTVAGLIGVKHFGKAGTIRVCNKGWWWAASILSWCVGVSCAGGVDLLGVRC
jgi:hypothetical protein